MHYTKQIFCSILLLATTTIVPEAIESPEVIREDSVTAEIIRRYINHQPTEKAPEKIEVSKEKNGEENIYTILTTLRIFDHGEIEKKYEELATEHEKKTFRYKIISAYLAQTSSAYPNSQAKLDPHTRGWFQARVYGESRKGIGKLVCVTCVTKKEIEPFLPASQEQIKQQNLEAVVQEYTTHVY